MERSPGRDDELDLDPLSPQEEDDHGVAKDIPLEPLPEEDQGGDSNEDAGDEEEPPPAGT